MGSRVALGRPWFCCFGTILITLFLKLDFLGNLGVISSDFQKDVLPCATVLIDCINHLMYREEPVGVIEKWLAGSCKAPDLEDNMVWRRKDGLWSQADHGANLSSSDYMTRHLSVFLSVK